MLCLQLFLVEVLLLLRLLGLLDLFKPDISSAPFFALDQSLVLLLRPLPVWATCSAF